MATEEEKHIGFRKQRGSAANARRGASTECASAAVRLFIRG
jgi:hypothetical protein